MKHFLIDIVFTVPMDQVEKVVPAHREFLQQGYDRQLLLMSGPKSPRTGGIVIGRAETLEAIQAFFHDDPYATAGVAKHHFTEFLPVKRQSFVEGWVNGA
jgi:uncharacterized protein YciI